MRRFILSFALFIAAQITYAEGVSDRQGFDPDMCYGSVFVRAESMAYKYTASAIPYCGELAKDIWSWTRQLHYCFCTRTLMVEIVYDRILEMSRTYYILCGHCSYFAPGASSIQMPYAPCSYPETTAVCNDVINQGWANTGECRSITEFYEIP